MRKFRIDSMRARVKFTRPINPEEDDIIIGGYCIQFNDGKDLEFDFCHYEGTVDENDPTILQWCQEDPDIEEFPDIKKFSYDDFVKSFAQFDEFTIEADTSLKNRIAPIEVLDVEFTFINGKQEKIYTVPVNKLPQID